MTQPVPPTLLGVLARRALALGAGALVVGGAARLASSEVRLASFTREATSHGEQLTARAEEARRAARLELDLALARDEARVLAGTHSAAEARVQALEAGVAEARAALTALELERERLSAAAADASATAAQRAQDLEQVGAELGARTRALAALEVDLGQAREAARELGARAEALARDVAAQRADLDAALARGASLEVDLRRERDERARLGERLGEASAALTEAEARARRAEERLERVAAAGVNLARLTGERPMPSVRATVLQVDLDAVPPIVVVDAGAGQGIERGDVLVIMKDGQEVARLEVDEVRGPYSSARIVRAQRGVRVQPGDVVRSR